VNCDKLTPELNNALTDPRLRDYQNAQDCIREIVKGRAKLLKDFDAETASFRAEVRDEMREIEEEN
jgi:hypothetical protein